MRKRKRSRTHEEAVVESLRRDPDYAAEYLSALLEDGDQEELMLGLRRLAEAFGGVPQIAKDAALNATTLYRTLSPQGNPELKTLITLLKALGLRLAIVPEKHRAA